MNLQWTRRLLFVIAQAAAMLAAMEAGAAEIAVDFSPGAEIRRRLYPAAQAPSVPSTPVSMPTGFPMGPS